MIVTSPGTTVTPTIRRFLLDPDIPLSPRDPIFGKTPFPDWVTEFRPPQWRAIVETLDAFERGAKFVFIDEEWLGGD